MSRPNTLLYDCNLSGCFNVRKRPKIERFHPCFPRGINFGDVDAMVELSGAFCLLEWKGDGGVLKTGQRLAYEAFVRLHERNVVFVVHGDPETMVVQEFSILMRTGTGAVNWTVCKNTSFEELSKRVARWAKWADEEKGRA